MSDPLPASQLAPSDPILAALKRLTDAAAVSCSYVPEKVWWDKAKLLCTELREATAQAQVAIDQEFAKAAPAGQSVEQKVLQWLFTGKTGTSSKCMAATHCGIEISSVYDRHEPGDPADFNRCLLLVEAVPEIRESFPEIAAINQPWAMIIKNWDELEMLFLAEAGRDWSTSHEAPKTWNLMCALRDAPTPSPGLP